MRILLAALIAIATPAWAANDREDWKEEWIDKMYLCARPLDSNARPNAWICAMRHAPDEGTATATARAILTLCAEKEHLSAKNAQGCNEVRAYIKQRWGTDKRANMMRAAAIALVAIAAAPAWAANNEGTYSEIVNLCSQEVPPGSHICMMKRLPEDQARAYAAEVLALCDNNPIAAITHGAICNQDRA
jgi:hypothetical protein